MSTPILSALVVLSLLIAAAIEVLAQRSAAYGGLALSPSLDAVPRYAMWSYLYGPNVVAALYSLIWSWVDLDVKRMQPWFELSKQGGATADGSIFLDYPYDFVATAPLKAFKRRHWPVFLAGTAMMIVFWAITPLQSAILGTGVVTLTEPAMVYARSRLAPVEDQVNILDPEFLNSGYAVGWLGQAMPDFMTPEFANLPFYVEDSRFNSSNITWAATTTRYSTELDCWPAEVEGPDPARQWNFLNGQGCNATVVLDQFGNYSMYYIGYYSSPYASHALRSPECPLSANSQHHFLAIWAEPYNVRPGEDFGITGEFNVTALYCKPKYFKEQVRLKVSKENMQPVAQDGYETIGQRETLGEDEFNSTAFEFLLHTGVVENPPPRDYPFLNVVEQHPRLRQVNFSMPVSNMVGYAYSRDRMPTKDYGNAELLHEAYSKAHDYLFSLAVSQLLVNDTSRDFDTIGELTVKQSAITVSRPLSAAVEALLLLVVIMTASLTWFCRNAPSNLQSNPSSLSRLAHAFQMNPALVGRFGRFDSYSADSLRCALRHVKFELTTDSVMVASGLSTSKTPIDRKLGLGQEVVKFSENERYYDPVKPWALRTYFGISFIFILSAGIIVLTYFKHLELSGTGLARPSQNFEVLQLLENYLPTMFATTMEPLWVLLTRLLCVLQPFRDLWQGKAKARPSINATYTSIPPQLVFWRAVRARHWLLGIVCMVAFLANLLTVSLGALFNEASATIVSPVVASQSWEARFNNESVYELGHRLHRDLITTNSYLDHTYIVLSNMSYATHLPPWTTRDFFFQPYDLGAATSDVNSVYTVETRGFGVNPNCIATGIQGLPLEFSDEVRNFNSSVCPNNVQTAAMRVRESTFERSEGRSAFEYCGTITSSNAFEICDRSLTFAWARTNQSEDMNGTIGASFLTCTPAFRTAMFDVKVDGDGQVLQYDMKSEETDDLGYKDALHHADVLLTLVNQNMNPITTRWHNDTFSVDWFNYLMTLSRGSREHLDPNSRTPDAEQLRASVEDIYSRQFAVLLSLQQDLFEQASANSSITGIRSQEETKIFMDLTAFIVSISVLALNLLVAVFFYVRSAAFVLPRMPTTLGSTLAYIAPSRWVSAPQEVLDRSQATYSFGRFIGHDKQSHVGVEMDPHVIPIDPASIGHNQVENGWGRLWRRRGRRTSEDWL